MVEIDHFYTLLLKVWPEMREEDRPDDETNRFIFEETHS